MIAHELLELLVGVLPARMGVEHVVEIGQHLGDPSTVLLGGPLECLLHALEALIEHLAAEQILDLLVVLPRLAAAPVVVGELLHGLRRRRRQFGDLHLLEAGVVVQRTGQGLALLEDRRVQQLAHLLQGAVEILVLQQFPPTTVRPRGEIVQAAHVLRPATQHLLHRAARRRTFENVLTDRVERLPQIDGWRQRIRTVDVRPVPGVVARHQLYTVCPSSPVSLPMRRAR